jgi:hypothetical protein
MTTASTSGVGLDVNDKSKDGLYKKVFWRIMPFLMLCFVIAYLDRVNVGFAKLQMSQDLGFSETVFGLGAGLFFIGYALFEVPSNMMLQWLGARRWLAIIALLWGAFATCMAFVHTAQEFYWLRFFLGAAEAGFFPGVIYYFTRWLPSSERGKAIALFLSGSAIASIISGPLSGYLLQFEPYGLKGWQFMIVAEGAVSVVLAAFTYLVARHHRNLYAPQDYEDPTDFFFGLKVPAALEGQKTGIATSDTSRSVVSQESIDTIEAKYKQLVSNGFAMLHQSEVLQARTSPKSGRYRVRVWIESIERIRPLSDIESVTYHVWHDFRNPVLATSDPKSNFDLWLNIFGEFPILALIKLRSGEQFEIQRFIDLPGRPPD